MDKSKIPADQRQALGALLDDHRAVKKLFKDFEGAKDESRKRSIAAETCSQLTVHAEIEEEIFYPSLRDMSDEIDDMLDEAKVEHQVAKDLMAILESQPDAEVMEATYKVLSEYVGHHVEEEETEMFKAVIKAKINLRDVAGRMASRKDELVSATA
ncbi:hemerythrin domain-containing protein [Cupriavidus sp. 30B13]|uniref:hemerythrin domain-containing protein n=1 Tax=Cupriavidus sp. 30B13 TaxID=3384241 RepID=UPI003B91F918